LKGVPHRRSIFICAGEVSGDLRGADLIAAMKRKSAGLSFFGIGGEAMIAAGLDSLFHIREMSILGFYEVIRQLPRILKIFRRSVKHLREQMPDCVILIDYPGFNVRLARKAKQLSIPVIYYISPQVWAWGKKRISRIAAVVDYMVVFFPFEEQLFKEAGVDVVFTGHPLKDSVKPAMTKAAFFKNQHLKVNGRTVGLFPGSRHQEIERLLPEMVKAVSALKQGNNDLQFILGKSPVINDSFYKTYLGIHQDMKAVRDRTYEVMAYSDVLIVASGTATLEAALLNTPMVIVYKVSQAEYYIAKRIVKIDCIGLANIVAGRSLVPELIQHEANASRIAEEVNRYLQNDAYTRSVTSGLQEVSKALGASGATDRAAKAILTFLEREHR